MKFQHIQFPKLPLFFYNSETRKKELFTVLIDNHVRMYTCGPTVYHYAHIGNFRTYVFEDIMRRTLKYFGYQVTQVVNLTDVDDKTIRGAMQTSKSLADFTQPYKNAFFVDLQTLGIEKAEHYPAATDYIPQMIDFIQKLLDAGVAYRGGDKSIYFAIDKCRTYGRLSHLKLDELKVGAGERGVESDEYDKENLADFVLWKAYEASRDGKVFWESPFGPGRPGWHLECSTMAISILGETIDIHAGAVDNIFPHHENEIAQSEAFSQKQFVRYWLHSEHLIVNGKKMSKSLGNFYTLRDLLERGYEGPEVRYMLMHTHYRTQLNFTFEGMDGARSALSRLNDFILRMQELADPEKESTGHADHSLNEAIRKFGHALADDLNTSSAIAALFDLMREINTLYDKNQLGPKDAAAVIYVFREFNRVLGIFNFETHDTRSDEMQALLMQREEARKAKDYKLADTLRQQIYDAGYVIEDTAQGVRLKKR